MRDPELGTVSAADASPPEAGRSAWIVSRPLDLLMVLVPFAVAALALAWSAGDGVPAGEAAVGAGGTGGGGVARAAGGGAPLWAFLALIVAFDVAHVWATLYLSYLDPEALRRRRLLFLLPIPLSVGAVFLLHLHSATLFWTLLAYVAIHHFAAQQYGFVALYRLRGRERLDRRLDKATLWVGALGPVLAWHASDAATRFDWFGHGERFLFRLDPALAPAIYGVMGAVALLYGGRQLQHAWGGRFNWGKNVWMLASWLSWSLGIGLAHHPLVSLALINLLHGIPFLVLVWYRCRRAAVARSAACAAADEVERPRLVSALARPRNLWAFYGLLLALALAEEGLWERYVWGNHLPRIELTPELLSLAVALLATPQVVHYFLDAWLWKLNGSNPDLEQALGLPPRAPRR